LTRISGDFGFPTSSVKFYSLTSGPHFGGQLVNRDFTQTLLKYLIVIIVYHKKFVCQIAMG